MSEDIVSVDHQEAASTSNHASHSGLPGPSGSSSVNPPNATTSTDTANNIGHLCGAESLSLTVQDILGELRQLTQALKASGPVCDCQDSGNRQEVPAAAVAEANVQQGASTPRRDETGPAVGSSNREKFQAEFRLLDETPQDIYQTLNARDEFLNLLKGSDKEQWLARELWAKFQPEPAPSEETRRWFDDAWLRGRAKCLHPGEVDGFPTRWYPYDAPNFASDSAYLELSAEAHRKWSSPPGNIWWITDSNSLFENDAQEGKIDPMTRDLSMIALLIQCFINLHYKHGIHRGFHYFIHAFSDSFRSTTRRSMSKYFWSSELLHSSFFLQYHLRFYSPLGPKETRAPSAENNLSEFFIRKRQLAWIWPTAQATGEKDLALGYFKERALSISLIMYDPCGAFKLVVLCDEAAGIDEPRWHRDGLLKVPEELKPAPGLGQFHDAMRRLLERWHEGWNETLTVIDQIVSFKMDHNKKDHGLDSFMFDDAGFMNLSKVYFTVLQLLRIARQWIDENFAQWENFCNARLDPRRGALRFFLQRTGCNDKVLESWDDRRDELTHLLKSHTQQLRDRIDKKSEEVKSLRDGLFSATSLREATKGMALNRAIYVFTAVTVIYTPLGFITALWALPILNTTVNGEDTRPNLPAFVATFVIIPTLTYVICGCLAWYYTSAKFELLVHRIWAFVRDLVQYTFGRGARKSVVISKV